MKNLFKMKATRALVVLLVSCAALFLLFLAGRISYLLNMEKIDSKVEEILSLRIEMSDVLGEELPPEPGEEAYFTIPGIDTNRNGIRDDVELAIFEEYPDSQKTRAALLQYAFALQLETTQPVERKETVIAVIKQEDRAYQCVGEILSRQDKDYFLKSSRLRSFVEERQFNTEERKKAQDVFYKKVDSYNSMERFCDIDYSLLAN